MNLETRDAALTIGLVCTFALLVTVHVVNVFGLARKRRFAAAIGGLVSLPRALIGGLGLGIFISAALKSQVLATQIAMVATYLPVILLSGFLFDIASMPVVLRAITHLVPARYYIVVTRGIFLKGVGVEALWPQAVFMIAFAVVGLGAATLVFHKELES